MRPELERRVVSLPVTTRSEGEQVRLGGYASVFNTETVIAGLFREQIAPGAFAEAVTQDDVRALFNHDPNFVIGRTASGTLTLREDETGLAYDVVPPDTQWARDLMVSVGRGDISQSSFAFGVPEGGDQWTRPERSGDLPLRTIRRAKLYDVSPVTYPAYESTTTAVRNAAATASCADSASFSRRIDETSRAKNPAFRVGDRVRSLVDHMPGMKGMVGRVDEARAGDPPYYAVEFDEPGEMENPHKWLTEDEIEAEGAPKKQMSAASVREADEARFELALSASLTRI